MGQQEVWRYLQEDDLSRFDGNGAHVRWLFGSARKIYGPSYIHILNIGIGSAKLERICYAQGWNVHALDIVPETCERLRNEKMDAQCGSIDALPWPDESMDVVFCAEVLEHLVPDVRDRGLHEIRRVLRPGGALIGSVPYCEDLSKHVTVCPNCSIPHNWSDHRKSFTEDTLREELESHGLKVKRIYLTNFIDFRTQSWTRKVLLIPFHILGRFGRGFTPITMGFVALKGEG